MGFSSYSRLRSGIFEPTHTISAPVVSQAIDLRGLTRPKRGQAVAAMGGGAASPLAGLGDSIEQVTQAARGPRKQQQGNPQQQQSNAEQARQKMQQSTLDNLTGQAASTASEPATRTGIQHPDGRVSMSTADTRDSKTVAATGQPLADNAIGPLGSFGEPTFGRAPGTWAGGAFGGF